MNIVVHADDFGLSQGINTTILDAVDNGALNSVSIIPNGYAFDEAIQEYKNRSDLRIAVHLNIFEGIALSTPSQIPLLVNKNGTFKHSFLSLWLRSVFSGSNAKADLQDQIRLEYAAQITKVLEATGISAIDVDSHVHFHMIPLVFETLLSLQTECYIASIRIPYEPMFFSVRSVRDLRNYVGPNIAKHILLNMLSRHNQKYVHTREQTRFLGVLFSGRMTLSAIKAGLRNIPKQTRVEVLFHPGRADLKEEHYWNARPTLQKYYRSEDRKKECDVLKDPETISVLHSLI